MKTTRRSFIVRLGAGGVFAAALGQVKSPLAVAAPVMRPPIRWYEDGFYLLHLDHHTSSGSVVGRQADPAETDRLLALSKPDVIQIHAKGNPGWTTYPTKIGHTPPKLARDVLEVWRTIARQRGYAWSIYYNLGRDGELMKRRPEWNRIDQKGQLREHALCYHAGVLENYIWPMLDEIMDHYDPDALWFDGSCFTVATCYCAKCRERFQRETGLAAPKNPDAEGWDRFKEMHRQIYREAISTTAARIKKKNPNCRVAFNWAYSLHMPEEPCRGVDHLTGDTGNYVDTLSVEAHWYDSQPLPFDLMTTIWYSDSKGQAQPKPREQMEQEMAIIIANGGRYHAWDNPSAESGLNAERQEYAGQVVAPFLRVRQRWCLHTTRVPVVSLLFTSTHHYAATRTTHTCFPNGGRASPVLRGAPGILRENHLDYEMISRERLLRQEIKTRCLLAEDLAALPTEEEKALRHFVEKGGLLVLTGAGLLQGELAEFAGLRVEAPALQNQTWELAQVGGSPGISLYRASLVAPQIEVLLTARLGAEQLPLVSRLKRGRGAVLAVTCPAFSAAKESPQNAGVLKSLRTWVLETAVPTSQRLLTTTALEFVETVLRQQGKDYILHLVSCAQGKRELFPLKHPQYRITGIAAIPDCEVALRLARKPKQVRLQPANQPVQDWDYNDGLLRIQIPAAAIHQMVRIRMS